MERHTELMNSPNMPPSAKPIPPAMTVLVGQDSNAAVIYVEVVCQPVIPQHDWRSVCNEHI